MNPRTLLHNEQLQELIDAVSPRSNIPEQRNEAPLAGVWQRLDEMARETAAIANANPWPNEPPNDCDFAAYMAVFVLICIFDLSLNMEVVLWKCI